MNLGLLGATLDLLEDHSCLKFEISRREMEVRLLARLGSFSSTTISDIVPWKNSNSYRHRIRIQDNLKVVWDLFSSLS
jgi:Tfp pilus assembly ATPase PilU